MSIKAFADLEHKTCQKDFPIFIPATQSWFNYIHGRLASSVPPDRFPSLFWKEFPTHFDQLLSVNRMSSGNDPCNSPMRFTASVVINGAADKFMGPLCCTLQRDNIHLLHSEPYLISEKSDGFRAIFVSYEVPSFPNWTSSSKEIGPISLKDIAMLERQSEMLSSSSSTPILELSGNRKFKVCGTSKNKDTLDLELCLISIFDSENDLKHDGNEQFYLSRSLETRVFTYAFDRAMTTAYLLLESLRVFSGGSSILDGEIICCHGDNSVDHESSSPPNFQLWHIIFFDIYATVKSGNYPNADGLFSSSVIALFKHDSLSTRLGQLRKHMTTDPLLFKHSGANSTIICYCKEYWTLHEMPLVFSKIRSLNDKVGRGKGYVYSGPYGDTPNDGLIFTPDKFDISSGSISNQLKWKWPDMITVDWLLFPCRPPELWHSLKRQKIDTTSEKGELKKSGTWYKAGMFFSRKRYGNAEDDAGIVKLPEPLFFPYEPSTEITIQRPTVCECSFVRNGDTSGWKINNIRSDKNTPNSIHSVISVLESMLENLNFDEMSRLLLNSSDSTSRDESTLGPKSAENQVYSVFSPCRFLVKANSEPQKQRISLYLFWDVRLPSKKFPIIAMHRLVRKCRSLGELQSNFFEDLSLEYMLLIFLANNGGSHTWTDVLVDAYFDSNIGRWVILKVYDKKTESSKRDSSVSVINVVMHLLKQLSSSLEIISDISRSSLIDKPISVIDKTIPLMTEFTIPNSSEGSSAQKAIPYYHWVSNILKETAVSYLSTMSSTSQESSHDSKVCFSMLELNYMEAYTDPLDSFTFKLKHLMVVGKSLSTTAELAKRYCVLPGWSTNISPSSPGYPGTPASFAVFDVLKSSDQLISVLDYNVTFMLDAKGFDIIFSPFHCDSDKQNFTVEAWRTGIQQAVYGLRDGGILLGFLSTYDNPHDIASHESHFFAGREDLNTAQMDTAKFLESQMRVFRELASNYNLVLVESLPGVAFECTYARAIMNQMIEHKIKYNLKGNAYNSNDFKFSQPDTSSLSSSIYTFIYRKQCLK